MADNLADGIGRLNLNDRDTPVQEDTRGQAPEREAQPQNDETPGRLQPNIQGGGEAPRDPGLLDFSNQNYSEWDRDRLLAALVKLVKLLSALRNIPNEDFTDDDRSKLRVKFLALVEQLISRFNIEFCWRKKVLSVKSTDGQPILHDFDVSSELLDANRLLQPQMTGADATKASNVIYGIRCVLCVPPRYKSTYSVPLFQLFLYLFYIACLRYVGYTGGPLRTRFEQHLNNIQRYVRCKVQGCRGTTPRRTGTCPCQSPMPKADYCLKHFRTWEQVNLGRIYVVDVLRQVPENEHYHSWEVVYHWLLRTLVDHDGFNQR